MIVILIVKYGLRKFFVTYTQVGYVYDFSSALVKSARSPVHLQHLRRRITKKQYIMTRLPTCIYSNFENIICNVPTYID